MQTCTTPARRRVIQRVEAGRFSRFGLHLNGECCAPDTPGSQPHFAGHIFHDAMRGAFARPVGDRALQLSIMLGTQQKARREAGLWVAALNRRQRVADAIS